MYRFLELLDRLVPAREVYAHCDIPCGIYKTEPMQTAAETVVCMAQLIQELEPPDFTSGDEAAMKGKANSMMRCVMVKEEHAQLCKEQALILWTDFFKPEHLELVPDLHEKVWKITKLCSKNKQEVNMEAAKELQTEVNELADAFHKVKASN